MDDLSFPVFYKLQLSSSFEYLEIRFSTHTRTIAAVLFVVSKLMLLPIVPYVPMLAFRLGKCFINLTLFFVEHRPEIALNRDPRVLFIGPRYYYVDIFIFLIYSMMLDVRAAKVTFAMLCQFSYSTQQSHFIIE